MNPKVVDLNLKALQFGYEHGKAASRLICRPSTNSNYQEGPMETVPELSEK